MTEEVKLKTKLDTDDAKQKLDELQRSASINLETNSKEVMDSIKSDVADAAKDIKATLEDAFDMTKVVAGLRGASKLLKTAGKAAGSLGYEGAGSAFSTAGGIIDSTVAGAMAGSIFGPAGAAIGGALGAATSALDAWTAALRASQEVIDKKAVDLSKKYHSINDERYVDVRFDEYLNKDGSAPNSFKAEQELQERLQRYEQAKTKMVELMHIYEASTTEGVFKYKTNPEGRATYDAAGFVNGWMHLPEGMMDEQTWKTKYDDAKFAYDVHKMEYETLLKVVEKLKEAEQEGYAVEDIYRQLNAQADKEELEEDQNLAIEQGEKLLKEELEFAKELQKEEDKLNKTTLDHLKKVKDKLNDVTKDFLSDSGKIGAFMSKAEQQFSSDNNPLLSEIRRQEEILRDIRDNTENLDEVGTWQN